MTSQTWLPIPGYEGLYEVSDNGSIRTVKTGIIRKLNSLASGHFRVALCKNGERRDHLVHRLVLAAFVGPCPEGMEACHNDGNPGNNNLANLRWDTRSANTYDRVSHGQHHQSVKTHCPQGHEYTEANTYRPPGYVRRRMCRACRAGR